MKKKSTWICGECKADNEAKSKVCISCGAQRKRHERILEDLKFRPFESLKEMLDKKRS